MTKKFFHNLNSLKVSYILISGQATVLYGAATFSEDGVLIINILPMILYWISLFIPQKK